VLLLIFFVIGLPAFILVFLCRNRWHLENDESVATALGPLFEVRVFVVSWFRCSSCCCSQCFVVVCSQPYRDDRFYMEPVVLLRRTIIVVLNVSLVLSPRWKYTSFALASMVFLLVHSVMSPFRTKVCVLNELHSKLIARRCVLVSGTIVWNQCRSFICWVSRLC
jgi:hypothetical protein